MTYTIAECAYKALIIKKGSILPSTLLFGSYVIYEDLKENVNLFVGSLVGSYLKAKSICWDINSMKIKGIDVPVNHLCNYSVVASLVTTDVISIFVQEDFMPYVSPLIITLGDLYFMPQVSFQEIGHTLITSAFISSYDYLANKTEELYAQVYDYIYLDNLDNV